MPIAVGQVHHFALGIWPLFFAYVVCVTGSVVGLACTLQSRRSGENGRRTGWLLGAAVSIGGVGIWLTHFIAMLGFTIPGMPVRYNVAGTVASAVMSISAVFVGLLVFGVRTPFPVGRLLLSGVVMGLGVNLAHYIGTRAVQIQGTITYAADMVWLSIAIAVVAATAALLFTVAFNNTVLHVAAGLIVGAGVTGMHYAGMAAIQVRLDLTATTPTGARAFTLLLPVLGLSFLALAFPIYAILMTTTWSDSDVPHHEDLPKPWIPSHTERPHTRHTTNEVRQVRGVAQYARQPTIPAQRHRRT